MEEILPKRHELKIWPAYFDLHISGAKTFELRKNDRQFKAGDTLWLREYFLPEDKYTGREIECLVTYVTTGAGLEKDYCCLGIKHLSPTSPPSQREGV